MKHAFLIIAHHEFEILQMLLSALDDSHVDFYVHIDRKVKNLPQLNVGKGRLFMIEDRQDVRWGSVTQIRCEMTLLRAAAAGEAYDFYHIISGTTLPLKTFDVLEEYFERHQGQCILSNLCQDSSYQETLKVRRYNLFLKNYSSPNKLLRSYCQFFWKAGIAVQRTLKIKRNQGKVFYKASNWLSLSQSATAYLLSREKEIEKTYRWSFCGDEYFIPSELMASPLRDALYSDPHYLYCEMGRANAKTLALSERTHLAGTGYLFARKFTAQ